MSHLTYKQIQDLADETAGSEKERLIRHTAECNRCAREVAIQRSLARAAKEAPIIKTSFGFTRKVMETIAPAERGTWLLRFFGGTGKTIAMIAVLGVIAYALTFLPGTAEVASEESELAKLFSGYYQQVSQFLVQESGRMSQAMTTQSSTEGSKILTMTVISLLALGLVDRFVLKPFLRARR